MELEPEVWLEACARRRSTAISVVHAAAVAAAKPRTSTQLTAFGTVTPRTGALRSPDKDDDEDKNADDEDADADAAGNGSNGDKGDSEAEVRGRLCARATSSNVRPPPSAV
jgi:hypothetical protein